MDCYPRKGTVHEGTVLTADDGFDCLDLDDEVTVEKDYDTNTLFVRCRAGRHYLTRHLEKGDDGKLCYVGFYVKT